MFTNEPNFQDSDFNKPFCSTTDAINVALGDMLSQGPIGFTCNLRIQNA